MALSAKTPGRALALATTALAITACGSLPRSGPSASAVIENKTSLSPVVEISPQTLATMASQSATPADPALPAASRFNRLVVGKGDALAILILETGIGSMLSPAMTNETSSSSSEKTSSSSALRTQLSGLIVDEDGMITVPYAGRVKAAGRAPREIEAAIIRQIGGKMVDPQVIVTIEHNVNSLVTVTGEVGQGMRIPLSVNGEYLLDALALAGGPKGAIYETYLQITRGSTTFTTSLQRILDDPNQNIRLAPGDTIFVYRRPQTFTVLGAAGHNAQITFEASDLTLTEAIGKAAGLQDYLADASGVFLFRRSQGEAKPVLYHFDMKQPETLILASAFPVQNRDMIYISDAPIIEVEKMFTVVGTLFGMAGTSAAVGATAATH